MCEREERTFYAGVGNDGAEYGVARLTGPGKEGKKKARKKPCPTCPWRKDAQIGRFPPEAYRSSASTCYDASLTTFSCHESGKEKPALCAGFLLANSDNNMAIRIAAVKGQDLRTEVENPDNVELYESYREMAIANGVDPDDPRIAPCRGDMESGEEVFERMRRAGKDPILVGEELMRRLTDEDHDADMLKRA